MRQLSGSPKKRIPAMQPKKASVLIKSDAWEGCTYLMPTFIMVSAKSVARMPKYAMDSVDPIDHCAGNVFKEQTAAPCKDRRKEELPSK